MYDSVVVAPSFMQRMIDHAEAALPVECCGVLGGKGSVVTSVYQLTNAVPSPVRYEAAAEDLFAAVRRMRDNGEDLIGIYHSHPAAPPEPSEIDRQENEYPGLFYFIISLFHGAPQVKCYIMSEAREFAPVTIV